MKLTDSYLLSKVPKIYHRTLIFLLLTGSCGGLVDKLVCRFWRGVFGCELLFDCVIVGLLPVGE